MFYCHPCALKRSWPESLSRSYGRCEMCGRSRECYDVPSQYLPEPPKKRGK